MQTRIGSITYAKFMLHIITEGELSFFRGHVAQLTQSISQLSLKPGDEEIKKKGWWQFWRLTKLSLEETIK